MTGTTDASATEQAAALWAVRLDEAGLDEGARAELDAWLAEAPARRGALLRAQAAWRMLDRARAGEVPLRRAGATRRTIWTGAGLAAGLAGLGGLGAWLMRPERYGTGLGQIRRAPLQDGSLALINTDTEIGVDMRRDLRRVSLDRGEAWFQVAKDRSRPFVVTVGAARVRAVGTAFSVRRLATGAEVQVTEGVVEVWSTRGGAAIPVAAGGRAFVPANGTAARLAHAPGEIDRSLSWRAGQIVLDGQSLGEAAAEFNRYNARKIVIADPRLAREPLVGRFRTNEPEAFARAAAATIGARLELGGEQIRFL